MSFARFLSISILLLLSVKRSAADTIQVDAEEFKRLAGDVADLREANASLQRRVTQLESGNEALQKALREANERSIEKLGMAASREDLVKVTDKLREIDQQREADHKLILEQFEKLETTLKASAEAPAPKASKKRETKELASVAPSKPIEARVLSYEIQSGDMLEKVLKTYNQQLEKDSRPHISIEEVQAANPGLNVNNLIAGRKLLLPVPDRK
jgi:uncharacterized protein YdiU (UPF0061 family)